ncbi:PKD domain-containing protein [Agromyces intestinalis]|uniref:PKD domain-containing protein n=1 Tax=Agromyces intestinalis TaxID=2592652 RepID=A0A5C1YGU6_9MICO|nr:PKD domain-containing protein [Agromyces intestinalis]QEO14745.1 PKD domain-containing protein [Agromyces intestinalis]
MMRRIGAVLAVTGLALVVVAPAATATAATPPDDDTGRSWEVAATRGYLDRSTGSNVWTGAVALLNVDDGSVRESPWGDYLPGYVAYGPDARTLYTIGSVDGPSGEDELLFAAHDASSGDVLWTSTISSYFGLAVSPDGSVAMTARDKIDLATHEVVSFEPCVETVADAPVDVAFSPDGSTAWIVCRFWDGGAPSQLRAYDVATLSLIDTIELTPEGTGGITDVLGGIAITPDGSTAMLSGAWLRSVDPIFNQRALRVDLATGTVASIVTDSSSMLGSVSISPDGTRAYLSTQQFFGGEQSALWSLDVATMTLAASSPLENYGTYPIVTPDGAKVFATGYGPWGEAGERVAGISAHDAATLAPLGATPLPGAGNLTITPDQAPVARLTASEPNSPVTFDASASTVEFGTIAEYAWDFGDGVSTVTTTPTVEHEYAEPGEYTATVRLTSSGGTSTEDVYTGHQLLRNGDASAVATVTVTVPEPAVPEPAVPGSGVAGALPPAGFNGATWVIAGIGMLLTGAIAVVIVRRRVHPQRKDA